MSIFASTRWGSARRAGLLIGSPAAIVASWLCSLPVPITISSRHPSGDQSIESTFSENRRTGAERSVARSMNPSRPSRGYWVKGVM